MLLMRKPIYLLLILTILTNINTDASEQTKSSEENAYNVETVKQLNALPYVLQQPQRQQEVKDNKRYNLLTTKSTTDGDVDISSQDAMQRQHLMEALLPKAETAVKIWDRSLLSPYDVFDGWKYANMPSEHGQHATGLVPVAHGNVMPSCNSNTPVTAALAPPVLMLMLNLGMLLYGLFGIFGLMQQLPLANVNNVRKQFLEREA